VIADAPVFSIGDWENCNGESCLGFDWDRVNFPPSSCCVMDLV